MSRNDLDDDGSSFAALLGAFGSHADPARRAKAERLAAMRPDDGRRRRPVTRPRQLNVRISEEVFALLNELREKRGWSQADLVEEAIKAFAKAEGKRP